MVSIDKIDKKAYFDFILKHFRKANIDVSHEIIEYILSISHLHTYYVQAIANFLYGLETPPKSIKEFELLYRDFIFEKSVFYSELPELITKQQFSVLKAIAKSGTVSNPNSAEFQQASKIKGPSSMHRAINSLLDKQLILKDNDVIRLYDVFLEHYLKYIWTKHPTSECISVRRYRMTPQIISPIHFVRLICAL